MPYANNTAYDFSMFEPKPKQQEEKQEELLKVVRPRASQRARQRAKAKQVFHVKAFCAAVLAVVLMSFTLYNHARLSELGAQVNEKKEEYNVLLGEYTRLQTELDSKISLRSAEEYASLTLGMTKVDQSQIKYLNLNDGDRIEVYGKNANDGFFVKIRDWIDSLVEYIL